MRLLERCFTDPIAKAQEETIKGYKTKIHRKRWGAIGYGSKKMLRLKGPMRRNWCIRKFMGAAKEPSEDAESEFGTRATNVDEWVNSLFWWNTLSVMEVLDVVFRKLYRWSEACVCHGDLYVDFDSQRGSAPLRFCRLPRHRVEGL